MTPAQEKHIRFSSAEVLSCRRSLQLQGLAFTFVPAASSPV